MPSQRRTIDALLERHGRTFAEELSIKVSSHTPSALFQLLCASVLYSARIDSEIATRSARCLRRHGWRTPQSMADSPAEERIEALTEGGYTRYRERTSAMLGDLSEFLLDRYRGDLRHLREEAERDPATERRLLKQVKGLGDVGVDIFFREVQVVWHELVPFADDRALKEAPRLKLSDDPERLYRLVDGPTEFARLTAALVRTGLAGDHAEVLRAAA
jgi:hypothetical protein